MGEVTTEQLIDYFLQNSDGDPRRAIAWLIGRMDASERKLKEFVRLAGAEPIKTTLEFVESRIRDGIVKS